MSKLILAALTALTVTLPVHAQIASRPTPPPIVTADNEPWYLAGEPLTFAGDFYYEAGAQRFFDGNVMVRTGSYRGVPLYADVTLEPYSLVFVPIAGSMMQPYERRRTGDLAGTTGSRPPSWPSAVTPERTSPIAQAPAPPTRAPAVAPLVDVEARVPEPAGTTGVSSPAFQPRPIETLRRPVGINGIWITFQGERWMSAGPAVPYSTDRFVYVASYRSFPVFVERGADLTDPRRIYVAPRAGVVSPFERR